MSQRETSGMMMNSRSPLSWLAVSLVALSFGGLHCGPETTTPPQEKAQTEPIQSTDKGIDASAPTEPSPKEVALVEAPALEPNIPQEPPIEPPAPDASTEPMGPDQATPEAKQETTPEPPPEPAKPAKVPVMMAYGSGQRFVMSCDGGKTWVNNQYKYYNPDTSYDYSHSPWNVRGLYYSDGGFVALQGWNGPGIVLRSEDGLKWKVTHDQADPKDLQYEPKSHLRKWYNGGVSLGNSVFIGNGRTGRFSSDGGRTWSPAFEFDKDKSRGAGHLAGFATGQPSPSMFVWGHNGPRDKHYLYSSQDGGKTWKNINVDVTKFTWCSTHVTRFFAHGQTIIFVSNKAADPSTGMPNVPSCVSTNGGKTWKYGSFGHPVEHFVWNGTHIRAYVGSWKGRGVIESTDGKSWKTIIDRQDPKAKSTIPLLTLLAYDPAHKVYVGYHKKSWQGAHTGWFLRSVDGIKWDKLPDGAYPAYGKAGGGSIKFIIPGQIPPNPSCP